MKLIFCGATGELFRLIECVFVASAGKDEINIKKADPIRNCFIAPPFVVGGTISNRF
jgi:hypothetical protein